MKKLILILTISSSSVYADTPLNLQEIYANVESVWPSPTPWLKERFVEFTSLMPKNAVVAEIGVQGGGFSAFALRYAQPKKLFLIDCWKHQAVQIYDDPDANIPDYEQEKLYRAVKSRFKHEIKSGQVKIIRAFSQNAVTQFPDEYFDWIYIDANHGYDAIKEDIRAWWPKVKKGGLMCGHDYILKPAYGVLKAVNEFLRDNNLYFTYLTTEDIYNSWAIQKP
jgi:hypothetical protein